MGEDFINLMPPLISLTNDLAYRWPKAETGCDYVNKQIINNKTVLVPTLLFYNFC